MKKFKCILTGVLLLMPIMSNADAPEIGKYPSVYEGSDYVVTVLRAGAESENTVLVKVEGIDNDFDGEIYLHTKKCDNTRCTDYKYETHEIPGKEKWWTIQVTTSYGYENIIMYPPGVDKKTGIHKVKRPKSFDAGKFYKEYLAQKALRKQ